jgi:type II secretory pathway component PulF
MALTRAFEYAGRDRTGTPVRGIVEAEDDARARARLREQGLFVTRLAPRTRRSFGGLLGRRLDLNEVAAFTFHLSGLISAGVPLLRGLETLREQTDNPRLQATIADLESSIQSGHSLSGSLSRHPALFSPLYIGVIRAGELAGALDQALLRLTDYLDREVALRHKIRSMAVYPAFVLALAATVVGLFVVFVIPAFETVYRSAGAVLPLPTRILMNTSYVVRHRWPALLVGTAAGVWTLRRPAVGRWARDAAERLAQRLPMVRGLARLVQVNRFVRTFSAMHGSGVPVLTALDVTTDALSDPRLQQAIETLKDSISRGRRLSDAMRSMDLFPPMIHRMVALGEEAGALDVMLRRASDLLDREIDYTIKRLVTLAEPVMTLALGGVVAGILMALYLPIFGLARAVLR